MPRKHQKAPGSRPYANWSAENLKNALESIRRGCSYRKAEEDYGIPKSTLERKINKKHMKRWGRPTEIDEEDEYKLVEGLIIMANWGYPLTHFDMRLLVKSHLDSLGVVNPRFKENMPGEEWCVSFLDRHKNSLSTRLCSNINRARAELSRDQMTEYFVNLQESLIGVDPENIINYDETNMSDDPGKKKVLIKTGSKRADRIIDSSKSSTSVMFAATASGEILPPYIVYKAEHMHTSWTQGGPPGARYNRSRSGWFDGIIFEDFFDTVIIEYFNKIEREKGKKCLKLIIGDNLSSHVSLNVIKKCEQHGIRFVFMPPNATHLCQPLDVSFFRALKQSWRNKLTEWKSKNKGVLPKDTFPRLLKNTLLSMSDKIHSNIISGFKAAGIYPCDPDAVLKRLPQEPQKITSSDTQWSETFLDFLKQGREKSVTQRQRRTRVNVAPGKSVTESDLNLPSTSYASNTFEVACYERNDSNSSLIDIDDADAEDPLDVRDNPLPIDEDDNEIWNPQPSNYHDDDSQITNASLEARNNPLLIDEGDNERNPQPSNYHDDDSQITNASSEARNNPLLIDEDDNERSPQPSNYHDDDRQITNASSEARNNTLLIDEDDNERNPQSSNYHGDDSQITNAASEANVIQPNDEPNKENICDSELQANVDDFVLVNLVYNEGTKKPVGKKFIAKIISIGDDGILCNFLRKSQKTENTFIYPPVEDKMTIENQNIIRILKQPTLNRGRHVFKDVKNIKF